MITTRRKFLATAGAAAGTVTVLPHLAFAAGEAYSFDTGAGSLVVHPVEHASVVMETPAGVIYADPVGDPAGYAGLPPADLILVTHEHGDHFNVDTLTALTGEGTALIANPRVFGMLPAGLQARASGIANGGSADALGAKLDAIPAYNTTEGRTNFHPEGRDNGYVLSFGDFRVYVSGDTEDIPAMRALRGIGVAFLCMNLPFTMDLGQAASALAEFRPGFVFPYHYRGRDGGTQDPAKLQAMVGDATRVMVHDWYNGKLS